MAIENKFKTFCQEELVVEQCGMVTDFVIFVVSCKIRLLTKTE